MTFQDKIYCASPKCTGKCGRKMTSQERSRLRGLKKMGKPTPPISYGYFCDIPEQQCKHEWDGVLINRAYAGNLGLCKHCGQECYVGLVEL